MTEAPLVSLRAVELHERPVQLRMPFRFGVVTLANRAPAICLPVVRELITKVFG